MSFIDQPGFADDVREVLRDLLALPPAFLDYTVQYAAVNPLPIPVSQITGFTQFSVIPSNIVSGASTRTSSTYGNLPDGLGPGYDSSGSFGPALPNGKYVFWWGAFASGNPGVSNATMILQANGSTFTSNACGTSSAAATSIMCADVLTLSNGNNNSVFAQYRSTDNVSTATFSLRWILCLKYANL